MPLTCFLFLKQSLFINGFAAVCKLLMQLSAVFPSLRQACASPFSCPAFAHRKRPDRVRWRRMSAIVTTRFFPARRHFPPMAENEPDLRGQPLFALHWQSSATFFPSQKALPFDSPLSARKFTHRKFSIVQNGGACPPFCENRFYFRPGAIFAKRENRPDLKDKPLFTFLWESSAAVFLSQKRDAFLIHSFPPWLCSPQNHDRAKVRHRSGLLRKHASLPARRKIRLWRILAGLEGTRRQRRRAGTPVTNEG